MSSSIRILAEDLDNPESVIRRAGHSRVQPVIEMMSQARGTLEKLDVIVKKHDLIKNPSRSSVRKGWDRFKYVNDSASIDQLRSKVDVVSFKPGQNCPDQ